MRSSCEFKPNKGTSLTHWLLPHNQQQRNERRKQTSGDSTKSSLIHLPAAGEGDWLLGGGGGAVISKRLGDDLPSLGEWPHSSGA